LLIPVIPVIGLYGSTNNKYRPVYKHQQQ